MAYLLIAVALFSGSMGYLASYKISQASILRLENAIEKGNTEAAKTLVAEQNRVAAATSAALAANANLDLAHDQDIKTINTLHDHLAIAIADKLRRPAGKSGCPDAVPAGTNPGQHQSDAADTPDFSEKLGGFLVAESWRADQCAVDKNTLLTYVLEKNCGISK